MVLSTWDCRCQTVPEAELQKAFSALPMSPEPGALCAKNRDASCELKKRELCSVHGVVKELLCAQNGSAAAVKNSPQAREATCDKQGGATAESAGTEDVEIGSCSRNGSEKESLESQGRSAAWDKQESAVRESLAAVEWIRSHPKITLGVLILLLLLVLALGVSLVVVSGRTQIENSGIPDTPQLLACPHDWIGYHGICYFLSRDQLSWDQAQARCSELGASLAVLKDEEKGFFFRLCGNEDHWLGLRRRGRELLWGDGSSFNSSVPVRVNAECVYLGDGGFRSVSCSQQLPFICSRPQARL